MMILGVIPARGGSKGIVGKNLYPLCDKSLIEYTIEAAQKSMLSDIILTTDDHKIAERFDNYTMRPLELAQDDTPMLPVIQHVLKEYGKSVDAVMILQPTSPLRTAEDINTAIALFNKSNAECLVSVCNGIHPMKSYTMEGKPLMEQIPYDKHLHGCYTRNGAIFITSKKLLDSGRLFDDRPLLYVMPKTRSIDIDDYEDLEMAEALLRRAKQ